MKTCPLLLHNVNAGFPSPAEDFIEAQLNLHEHMVKKPCSTFFLRVGGNSMTGAGIFPNDILVVDRSLEARNRDLVVALIDGCFTLKQLQLNASGKHRLLAANPAYKPIENSELEIWGVVTGVARRYK